MAARRRRPDQARTYVDGNTVRKTERHTYEEAPGRSVREQSRHSRRVMRNQAKARYVDGPYVFALTIAAVVPLFLCMNYLKLQSSISSRLRHIEELELKLEHLKSENDALETRIDTFLDLDYVFKVATEELGMVYANKDQILLYDKTESEYVRQYEDIPEH